VNSLHGFFAGEAMAAILAAKSQQKHDFFEKANKIKEIFASFL
jgi:hypothetical protein